jgi:hypothetical protein
VSVLFWLAVALAVFFALMVTTAVGIPFVWFAAMIVSGVVYIAVRLARSSR